MFFDVSFARVSLGSVLHKIQFTFWIAMPVTLTVHIKLISIFGNFGITLQPILLVAAGG